MASKDLVPRKAEPDNLEDEILRAVAGRADDLGYTYIPAQVSRLYEKYHGVVLAHAHARGTHDALLKLALYVIWKYQLFRAHSENATWNDYCLDVSLEPHGLSVSNIKHSVSDIDDMLKRGMTVENILDALANRPMAAIALVKAPEAIVGDINAAYTGMKELGPHQSDLLVKDITGEPKIWCDEFIYSISDSRAIIKIICLVSDGKRRETDFILTMLELPEAKWLAKRFSPRKKPTFIKLTTVSRSQAQIILEAEPPEE